MHRIRTTILLIAAIAVCVSDITYGQLSPVRRVSRVRNRIQPSKSRMPVAFKQDEGGEFTELESDEAPKSILEDSDTDASGSESAILPSPVDAAGTDGTIVEGELLDSTDWFAPDCNQQGCASCSGPYEYKGLLAQGLGIDHLSVFGGIQGFKNQFNRGQSGSFGFNEGANFGTFGRGLILPPSFGAQIGFRAIQANLSGAEFTTHQRNQFFVTTGLYRRADCGLQGGVAFDYLNDDWYSFDLGLGQIRGELSWATTPRNDFGFWFASSTNEEGNVSQLLNGNVFETWQTVNQYAFFYRTGEMAGGRGEARVYGGWTGQSDGIIGADSRIALINGWSLESEFAFLIPREETGIARGHEHESWNVGINLVWYPGSLKCGSCRRYHRPLFDVADNGSMIIRRQ